MRQPGYLAAVCSDQGTVRSRNEDNFFLGGYCLDQNAALRRARVEQPLGECAAVAVFDGMGGERRGDEASRLAADCLADWAEHLAAGGDPGEYVEAANADICAAARRAGGTMGSTLVLAVLGQTGCTVYNVGDSRAFLWREYEKALKEQAGEDPLRREGYRDGTWVLLDYGCVCVHVFSEEAREFYSLERL